jgi:peptide/nickel transport system substrate-binding protein
MKREVIALALVLVLALLTPLAVAARGQTEEVVPRAAPDAAAVPSEFTDPPSLAARIRSGELPPIDERLPRQPLVLQPNHEIGVHGGTLVRGNIPQMESNLILNRPATDTEPNIVRDWEFSDEGRVLTLYLREGLKWSDGAPVTADDYLFGFYDVAWNEEINPVPPGWARVHGEPLEMEKVDDFTVRIISPRPYYALIHQMNMVGANWFFSPWPKHWFSTYHADYNENANQIAQQAGFDTWYLYFRELMPQLHADHGFVGEKLGRPTLNPWVFVEETPTTYVYERNPFYFKVDTEGNQLPYIDRHVAVKIDDAEVRLLKILNGELDFAAWGVSLENYPVIKGNEAAGGYEAWVAADLWASGAVFVINQTYDGENAEVVAPLLRELEFRQALSLAIDRETINELVALGQGTIRQAAVHPDTPGYNPAWGEEHPYLAYDPAQANELLDNLGLTRRDSAGFRLDPQGRPFALNIPINPAQPFWLPSAELVRDHWQAVGIRTNVRTIAGAAFSPILNSSTYSVFVWVLDRMHGPAFVAARGSWLNPNFWFGPIGPFWKNWLGTDGREGEEPPQLIKDLFERAELLPFVSPEEQVEITRFIGDTYAENLWMIGTFGMPGKPVVAKTGLGNVRRDAYPDNISTGGVRNNWMEQFYWRDAARRNQ